MKKILQLLLTTSIIIIFSNYTCNKSVQNNDTINSSEGFITGFDERLCPCCGGFMINFEGETRPYTGDFYLIDNDISSYGISTSSAFPIKVMAEWKALNKCNGKYIQINKLTKL